MQLSIKGKDYRLVWGTGCFEDFCDRLGVSLIDIDLMMADNQNKTLNQLTYSALRNGADIDDVDFSVKYSVFTEWLDNEPQSVGTAIMEDYLASKYLGKTMQEYYNEIIARFEAEESATAPKATPKKKATRLAK